MSKLVLVVDTNRCSGCHACALACKVENNLTDKVWWNQVYTGLPTDYTGNEGRFVKCELQKGVHLTMDVASGDVTGVGGLVNDPTNKNVTMQYYTKSCQHCEKPLCLDACAFDAIYKDEQTGIVDTYFSKCVGCNDCIKVCPYDARATYDKDPEHYIESAVGGQGISPHKKQTVDKCSFCSHRVKVNKRPACVEACSSEARFFGDIEDPSIQKMLSSRTVVRILEAKGTGPSVYFLV